MHEHRDWWRVESIYQVAMLLRPPAPLSALVLTLVASCTSISPSYLARDEAGECGRLGAEEVPWHVATQVPEVAGLLIGIVGANVGAYRRQLSRPVDTWFEGPSGELMLCITPSVPKGSRIGAWWSFRNDGGEWRLAQNSEWISNQD